MVDYNFISR